MKPSRLDVRHLRYAIAVADAGGFRRASEALNVAQPAISKSVKDAETDLGFAIFERFGTGVGVTDAGRTFLEDARLAVAQFERAIRASRRNAEGARGHIIVGYSALATAPQISEGLDAFHAAAPGVQVEMHVMSTDNILKSLRSGTIDVGFLLSHPTAQNPAIQQVPVWRSRIGVVAPHGALPTSLEALAEAELILGVRENWRSWRLLLDEAFVRAGIMPHVIEEVWDIQVILQRVAEGRGFTLLPMSSADSFPASLGARQVEDFCEEVTIAMAWGAKADTGLLHAFRRHFLPR
ncbi:LysR family transcriptional regulator [Roseivivax sp. THAF30]|uniref:LysR family transcriptional regulator n=1 Tax=Roseivivax sp. THAF30 TaxID=2587852 RepID=UPI001267B194|nr:LysR family transcriptional regulator [Roseivivax sp. THAF30]QFT61319.1 HTH-type transcriptional regulator TdfR [Roseivivax sp. THAF30]